MMSYKIFYNSYVQVPGTTEPLVPGIRTWYTGTWYTHYVELCALYADFDKIFRPWFSL